MAAKSDAATRCTTTMPSERVFANSKVRRCSGRTQCLREHPKTRFWKPPGHSAPHLSGLIEDRLQPKSRGVLKPWVCLRLSPLRSGCDPGEVCYRSAHQPLLRVFGSALMRAGAMPVSVTSESRLRGTSVRARGSSAAARGSPGVSHDQCDKCARHGPWF